MKAKKSTYRLRHSFPSFRLMAWSMALLAGTAGAHAGTPANYTGANGNWNVGANWSTNPVVPINAGLNTYDVTIAGKTVAFNVPGSSAVDSLGLTTSTLNLLAGASLSVVSGLTASASTINAQQSVFAVSGTVSMSSASLFTGNGGSMTLPGLTTYSTTNAAAGVFQAEGATSTLLLPALTTVSLVDKGLTARAQNGADVELNGLTTLSGTGSIFEGVTFQAAGAGSDFRANALPSVTMNGASITVQATNGGRAEMNALATVSNGGSVFGSFNAYADGASALVSLPVLTTINLTAATNTLRATAGGNVEVPMLNAVTALAGTGQLTVESRGTLSRVNLGSSLTTLRRTVVTVQGGGTVLWGSPTTMIGGGVTIDGSGTLNTSALASLDSTNLTATNGATLALPTASFVTDTQAATWQASAAGSVLQMAALTSVNLTDNDLTVLAQSGGSVQLPALNFTLPTTRTLRLQANGSGSQVNVPLLGPSLSRLDVIVQGGGSVLWGSPQTLRRSSVKIDASGTVNLATLTNINSTSLNAVNGATLTVPLVTAYSTVAGAGATLEAGAGSTLALPAVTSITNPGDVFNGLTFRANGAAAMVALGALQTVTMDAASITFQAQNGGTLQANALATVNNLGSIFGKFNVQAENANSQVLLTGLNTMQLNGAANTLRATSGGTVEMPGLTTVTTTGNIFEEFKVESIGPGSLVNLAGLTSTVPFKDSLVLRNGGRLALAGMTSPFDLSFEANFANASTGTLDVFLNQTLLQSITPGNFGNFSPYLLPVNTFQPGGAVIEFFANGSGASLTLQNYSVSVPEPGAACLFGFALCGLATLRRRRKV